MVSREFSDDFKNFFHMTAVQFLPIFLLFVTVMKKYRTLKALIVSSEASFRWIKMLSQQGRRKGKWEARPLFIPFNVQKYPFLFNWSRSSIRNSKLRKIFGDFSLVLKNEIHLLSVLMTDPIIQAEYIRVQYNIWFMVGMSAISCLSLYKNHIKMIFV